MRVPCPRGLFVLSALAAVLAVADPASAQVVGWFSVQAGQVAGGDTTDNGGAWAASAAAFERDGWLGADIDFAHAGDFNRGLFDDSGITTLMVNAIARVPRRTLQPYLLGGGGAIRVRGCVADCARTLSKTEFGLDAGAGVQYRLTDYLSARAELRYFRILGQLADLPRTSSGSFDFFRWTIGASVTWLQE